MNKNKYLKLKGNVKRILLVNSCFHAKEGDDYLEIYNKEKDLIFDVKFKDDKIDILDPRVGPKSLVVNTEKLSELAYQGVTLELLILNEHKELKDMLDTIKNKPKKVDLNSSWNDLLREKFTNGYSYFEGDDTSRLMFLFVFYHNLKFSKEPQYYFDITKEDRLQIRSAREPHVPPLIIDKETFMNLPRESISLRVHKNKV